MSETVESLQVLLEKHAPWACLTGAGISSASGIPTYRDHHGRWLGSQPIQHQEFVEQATKRQRYWARSILGWPRVHRARPNQTHHDLVALETAGVVSGLITQNVDRLHQQAGAQHVIDLHGRLDRVRCLSCGHTETRARVQDWLEEHNALPALTSVTLLPDGDADLPAAFIDDFRSPHCHACEGILMPDVVFFGGTVPVDRVQACYQMIDQAEGLLVIGSSLSVYSGFRFCRYAVQQGKPLVILNAGQTRADELCVRKFDDHPFSLLSHYAANLDPSTPEHRHV